MHWEIIFAGMKARPVRTWALILLIALQVFLVLIIPWLVTLCFAITLVFLSMYANITEQTREIGILRSIGASKTFIASLMMKEALVTSLIGFLLGSAGVLILAGTTEFDSKMIWILTTAVSVGTSGVLGALISALRNSSRDLVQALDCE